MICDGLLSENSKRRDASDSLPTRRGERRLSEGLLLIVLSKRTLRVEVVLVVRVRCSGRLMVCEDREELRESERESIGVS